MVAPLQRKGERHDDFFHFALFQHHSVAAQGCATRCASPQHGQPEVRVMPYVETHDGCNLFYRDWGSGMPVVFLHGWSLGCDMWEYQMPWLVDAGLRCVAFDA